MFSRNSTRFLVGSGSLSKDIAGILVRLLGTKSDVLVAHRLRGGSSGAGLSFGWRGINPQTRSARRARVTIAATAEFFFKAFGDGCVEPGSGAVSPASVELESVEDIGVGRLYGLAAWHHFNRKRQREAGRREAGAIVARLVVKAALQGVRAGSRA